jgi:alcohol dehydrogenase
VKSAQISEYGDVSVIKLAEIDKPKPGEGEVLIEVHAASLNPFDTTVRTGGVKDMAKVLPITLGGDLAGVVAQLGLDTEGFKQGDKVYGQALSFVHGGGSLAEFSVAKTGNIAKMPEGLDFKQAAALPLVGCSAIQALTEHINLKPNQKIFIHGGAGGIGSIAIQIAKHIGAYVATTASGDGLDLVSDLGANIVIDYKAQDFAESLKGYYDAVFNTVRGDDFNKSLNLLKKGGIAVSMTGLGDEAKAKELGVTMIAQNSRVTNERLNKLCQMVESGAVNPQIGKVFSLDEVKQAFVAREAGGIQGKVVVEIKPA